MDIVDKYGLVNEQQHLILFFPQHNGYLCFRIHTRLNKGFERLLYGPLPVQESGYEDGVIPAGSVKSYKFPSQVSSAGDRVVWKWSPPSADDIFYFSEEDKIFDVMLNIQPAFLRNYIYYPTDQPQISFREKKVTVDPHNPDDLGFFRSHYNMIFLPKVDVEFFSANNTNVDLRTFATFTYAEYVVEMVTDKEKIRDLIVGEKAKLVTMPYFKRHSKVEDMFTRVYEQKPIGVGELT